MRKKPMRWLAAGMALCLTLVTTPAASAAQPPRTRPFLKKSFLIPSISKTKDVT